MILFDLTEEQVTTVRHATKGWGLFLKVDDRKPSLTAGDRWLRAGDGGRLG